MPKPICLKLSLKCMSIMIAVKHPNASVCGDLMSSFDIAIAIYTILCVSGCNAGA